jgi:hypothetical protein
MCQCFGAAVALYMLQDAAHGIEACLTRWTHTFKVGILVASILVSPTAAKGNILNIVVVRA